MQACLLLGMNFDRINLETNEIERLFEEQRTELGMSQTEYVPEPVSEGGKD